MLTARWLLPTDLVLCGKAVRRWNIRCELRPSLHAWPLGRPDYRGRWPRQSHPALSDITCAPQHTPAKLGPSAPFGRLGAPCPAKHWPPPLHLQPDEKTVELERSPLSQVDFVLAC